MPIYLELPGIAGDVKGDVHDKWFLLEGFTITNIARRKLDPKERDQAIDVTVVRKSDAISPTLMAAQGRQFDEASIDSVRFSETARLVLVDAAIARFQGSADRGQGAMDTIDLHARAHRFESPRPPLAPGGPGGAGAPGGPTGPVTMNQPPVRPASHPVVRAHNFAVNEHSTINLRPERFVEIALPVLLGDGGARVYPPSGAVLRLASNRGYERRVAVSGGMVTNDEFCSLRFYDVSEKSTDELFTATLENNGKSETIFRDRPIATYIVAARQNGKYETAFAQPAADTPQPATHDGLLAPVGEA